MADFFPLIDRAVLDLAEPTADNRDTVYALARTALEHQIDASDLSGEKAALEQAITRVEAKFASFNQAPETSAVPTTKGDGRRQFAFNAAASGGVSLVKMGLQLIMLPLMARLLGPTAYGIYSLALPTVVFFVLLADGGLGASLAREDEANKVFWSTAFWVLLGTCSGMAVLVACSGFLLAWMSGQSSLIGIMALLSLALPLLALMVPADARLVRRGNLLYHSGGDLAATLIGAACALALAFAGAGAWSLAVQYIVAFAIRAAVLNFAAWSPPALVFDLKALSGHLSTGGATLMSRIAELLGKVAENSLFGHIFGATSLGSYTFSNQVSRFACDAVTNPIIGAFYAHALHASDAAVSALHARLSRLTMLVLMPATAVMAAVAPTAFPIVLGTKWADAAPLFQAVVLPYALLSMSWLSGQVLLKHGMVGRGARVQVAAAVVRIVVVAIGYVVSPFVVACLIGLSYAVQAIGMILAVPLSLRESFLALVIDLCPAIAAAGLAAGVAGTLVHHVSNDISGLLLSCAIAGFAYLAILLIFGGRRIRTEFAGDWHVLRLRSI